MTIEIDALTQNLFDNIKEYAYSTDDVQHEAICIVIKRLIRQGADVNGMVNIVLEGGNFELFNPIRLASCMGCADIISILIDNGADIDSRPFPNNKTTMALAAEHNHLASIDALRYAGAAVNATKENAIGALSLASYCGNSGAVGMILAGLEGGEKYQIATKEDCQNALIEAVSKGHSMVVRQLISSQKITINQRDIKGRTPLMIAAISGNKESIVKIMQDGGDASIIDKDGNNAFALAAISGNLEVMDTLLDLGHAEDIESSNLTWRTPLIHAIEGDHLDVVEFLLKKSSDVNKSMKGGHTPLMIAIYLGHYEIFKTLIETDNVDFNLTNNKNENVADIAQFYEDKEGDYGYNKLLKATLAGKDAMREGDEDDAQKEASSEVREAMEDISYHISKIPKITMPSYCKTKIDPNIKKPGPSLQAIEKFNIGRESSKLAANSDSRSK